MDFTIHCNGDCIQYKNNYFADVYEILVEDFLVGFYYEDNDSQKNWYALDCPAEIEPMMRNSVENQKSSLTSFGEECIYTHGIYAVEKLLDDLYPLLLNYKK